jgi:hypothetical protein
MTVFDFDEYGKAHVPEEEFMAYLEKTEEPDDYVRVVNDKVLYYNGGGCLLAEYDRNEGWGRTY